MSPLGQIFGYLSGALLLVVLMLGVTAYSYRAKLAEAVTENTVCEMNKKQYEEALNFQNGAIEDQRIDYETRLANVKPITRVVVKEKLKVVYREHNVSKGECDEVFSTLDAIRRAGF